MRTPLLCLFVLSALPGFLHAEPSFEQRVAPLLRQKCLVCHNPDKSKGDLDLSTRAAALKGGSEGPALTPGKPDESLLLTKVLGAKPKMPRGGEPLTAEQIADLRRWIADGAAWPESVRLTPPVKTDNRSGADWWAYRPLARPELPKVKESDWIRTPVDRFILAKLTERGLAPAPEADRTTLIRRLTYDLHGLPPTPEEIDAFVADPAADAYGKLVDRLLASPRYGERWGRHWLDTVHFADTHGYDKDQRRDNAWPYRDYVIQSINQDKPYARFIREQIAGDVLFPDDPECVVATGFVAAGPWDFVGQVELREGTTDKEITRLLDRDDMVTTTANSFLSMTVGCARCHDHKFDPISQKDYYRLQAVFAGVDRGDRTIPLRQTPEARAAREQRLKELLARQAELTKKLELSTSPELARTDAELLTAKKELAALPPAPAETPSPSNGWHSQIAGQADAKVWVQVDLGKAVPLDEIRLYPARPTDFADTPGFGFPVRFKVEASAEATFTEPVVLDDRTKTDFPNPGDAPYAIRPTGVKGRYIRITANRFWKRLADYVVAFAELEVDSDGKNIARGAAVTASDSIEGGRWSAKHLTDGFNSRTALPDLADPKTGPDARKRLELQGKIARLERDRTALVATAGDPALKAELARVAVDVAKLQAPPTEKCYAALPHAPRPIKLLHRGDVNSPRDVAGPGALSLVQGLDAEFKLDQPDNEGARRAALAAWIADPRDPPPHLAVDRQPRLGESLRQGDRRYAERFRFQRRSAEPSGIARLARGRVPRRGRFAEDLHRLLVTSAAYRQSSRPDAAAAKIDADNRLIWRVNRRRLDAESLRDAILQVSGRLNLTAGGPGFDLFWFKPDHSPTYDYARFEKDPHPETERRTVYRFAVRSVPNPFLECLDAADPNLSTPVRNTTNTALQALALLNDPFVVRQAEHFAQRVAKVGDRPAQIALAYRLALGRKPTAEETAALTAFADKHGLPQMCRLLLNTNEFLFID